MTEILRQIVGPRVSPEELASHPIRYAMPTILLSIARVLLLLSVFMPYWHMELVAPQYPDGLYLTAYVNTLQGDVKEINGLNHYIGMKPLEQAAQFEKTISVWAVVGMFLLVEGAMFVHSRWAVLLALPAVCFPAGFLMDLHYWMKKFGLGLDPSAPLSSSVKPFTPTILGEGGIGQFKTFAEMGWGMYLAMACSAATVVGFYFHWRAYRNLPMRTAGATPARVATAA